MPLSVRRLGPADERTLALLSRDDADFDLAERGAALDPLPREAALAYLSDPNVLHWIAELEGEVVGHLYCNVVRKRNGAGVEILLYEIGVRSAHRRTKVGRALVDVMHAWMHEHHVVEAWVLADNPGAVAFYRACGFAVAEEAPVYMTEGD